MLIETEPVDLGILIPMSLLLGFMLFMAVADIVSRKGWKNGLRSAWLILLLIMIFPGLTVVLVLMENHNKNTPFQVELAGVYDHAGYTFESRRSAPPLHTTRTVSKTIIYLGDGRTYLLDGSFNIPFETGDKIVIERNAGLIRISKENTKEEQR